MNTTVINRHQNDVMNNLSIELIMNKHGGKLDTDVRVYADGVEIENSGNCKYKIYQFVMEPVS